VAARLRGTGPGRLVGSGSSAAAWAADVAVAAAVTAITLWASVAEAHPTSRHPGGTLLPEATYQQLLSHQPGGFLALVAVAGVAVVWRRRYPVAVLLVTVAADGAYAAAGFVDGGLVVPVLVALYTVAMLGARGGFPPSWTSRTCGALALAVGWMTAGLGEPFGWLGGPNSVRWAVIIAAVAVGTVRGNRRQLFVAMTERAERAEQTKEEEARRRVDAERLRIARELHDVVAHSMSMINVQAGAAAHVLEHHPEQAAPALQAIKAASREGLRELRAILNVLRQADEGEDVSPAPSLDNLSSLVSATRQAGLEATASVAGEPRALPPSVELAAYRIVQESLTNVLRHARATRAAVALRYEPDALVVDVDDDGRAFDHEFTQGAGAGIAGMRERAEALGGAVEAGPKPEGGWRVSATLPAPPPKEMRRLATGQSGPSPPGARRRVPAAPLPAGTPTPAGAPGEGRL
jgi:signal transduction histidine kinase